MSQHLLRLKIFASLGPGFVQMQVWRKWWLGGRSVAFQSWQRAEAAGDGARRDGDAASSPAPARP